MMILVILVSEVCYYNHFIQYAYFTKHHVWILFNSVFLFDCVFLVIVFSFN
jgi:hypothetical protein